MADLCGGLADCIQNVEIHTLKHSVFKSWPVSTDYIRKRGTTIMNELQMEILHRIGNTSLLPLRSILPENGARILLKQESENPTGSMKDRMALAMIEAAEVDACLTAGGSVVEYTGGSTGVSLSLICTVKGYPLHIVTSDASPKKNSGTIPSLLPLTEYLTWRKITV